MVTNGISNGKKVALGLSGGVDSSVSAYLLLEQGYEVTGVFMQCWDFRADGCKAEEDRALAVETASKLGIKFIHLDYREHYNSKVMQYFYAEYKAGRTPNPDVMCNKEIKFGLFFDWAMQNGFDYVATGHYARVKPAENGSYELLSGVDTTKDQSYFLYQLEQRQLQHTLFPVGDLKKAQVRKIAQQLNLPTAARPDSMGICFIGEVDIKEFLKKHIQTQQGEVIDLNGEVIGTHEGAWFYTIGQRHGFNVTKYSGTPLYVISRDVNTNRLTVGTQEQALRKDFTIEKLHVINPAMTVLDDVVHCDVRIRHLGKFYECTLVDRTQVILAEPAFGVAPGQSAVFYMKDVVLGGGVIA